MGALQQAVDSYYTINDVTFDFYGYEETVMTRAGIEVPASPVLTVVSYSDPDLFQTNQIPSMATTTRVYDLNQTYLGPVDPVLVTLAEQQTFFHSLVYMTLAIPKLRNFAFGSLYRSCFVWSNEIKYDFRNRGQLE